MIHPHLNDWQRRMSDVYAEAMTHAGDVESLKRRTLPYESVVTAFMVVDELPFEAAVDKLKRQLGPDLDRETTLYLVIGCLDALLRSHELH